MADARGSQLVLFEDGRSLGPPHSSHEVIRSQGSGRYSYWGDVLYFSSSDGSDPATNARQYVADAPIAPRGRLTILALAGAAWIFANLMRRYKLVPAALRGLKLAFAPIDTRLDRWICVLIAITTIAFSWVTLIGNWYAGRSVGLAIGGFFPVSDAYMYFGCASGLIDYGHFTQFYEPTDFCTRRPIYSSLLASLQMVAGRELHAVLLLQAATVAVALAALAREVARLSGPVGALVITLLLLRFAGVHAFSQLMSENAGLAFGAVALALLLRSAETGSNALAYVGIAMFSIALNARAGALVTLPMLVLWSGWRARSHWRRAIIAMVGAAGAVGVGVAIETGLIVVNGGGTAHGNFAYVLYELSVDGKDWTQALSDHPEINALPISDQISAIFRLALDNIWRHPSVFLRTLAANFVTCLTRGAGLSLTRGATLSVSITAVVWWLWIAGGISTAVRWREPRHTLLGFLTIGTLLSGPFIIHDGGPRVFAATIGIDAVLVTLGLMYIARFVYAAMRHADGEMIKRETRGLPWLALILAVVLIAGTLAAYTPLRRIGAVQAYAAAVTCAPGETPIVTDLDGESTVLNVTGVSFDHQILPARVPAAVLQRDLSLEWMWPIFDVPAPTSFVLAHQRLPGQTNIYYIMWHGDVAPLIGKTVRICLDAQVSPAGFFMYRARTIDALDGKTN